MAFDWNTFTANFLNTISTGINERLEAQDDEKELLEKEYEQARTVFNNRKKLVSSNMMLVGKARNLGAGDEQIKAAISSGEAGLSTLVKAMEKHVMKTGRGTMTRPEVDTLVEGAELFEEGDVKEFLQKSYGLEREIDTGLIDDRTTFQKVFATGSPKTAAKLNFGKDRVSMIELARQDAYDSLAPDRRSVYLTTDQARVFDIQQGMRDFNREMELMLNNIDKSKAYLNASLLPDVELPDGSKIPATRAVVDRAKAFIIEKYVKLGGQTFIDNLNPELYDIDPSLIELVTDEQGIEGNKNTSKRLIEATAADQGTLVEEVKGNITLRYNVDPDGRMLGNITFITPTSDGGLLEREIEPTNTLAMKELNEIGFNFDTLYADDGTIDDILTTLPQPSFLAGEPITTEVLPAAEKSDPDDALGLPSEPSEFEKDEEVDPKDTPNLADDIKGFFVDLSEEGGLAGRAIKRRQEEREAEEGEETTTTTPTDITVYGTTTFGEQNFTVTVDNKVYINDDEGNPKSEVKDQGVVDAVLNKQKTFIDNAITTFIRDANDQGILNDKGKLLAYWRRFSGKNRLSPHVIKQVTSELVKQLDL